MSTLDAHLWLKSRVSVLSYIGDVNIFDADGQLINSSSDWPLPNVNIADRPYFKTFKADPESKIALAEPVRSYFTGKWTTVIAHRMSGPNGAFLGVMTRRIDPVNFEKFFASVALGEGAAISMFHRDGTLLARYPRADDVIGQKFKSAPLLHSVLIDHIPTQITVKDVRYRRYVLANRVAESQFGLSRDAIIGKTALELFPKASSDIINADDERALQSPDGLFLDVAPWQTQGVGQRFITSRRIGIPDQSGETRFIINVVEDVTERRRADEKIAHLAHYDALTDLPNRVLFPEQIERAFERTGRGEQFALLYIDIDEFKGINDSLGHHVGDELLKTAARRIRDCIGENDLIARLGGDEFAVIQTGVDSISDVVEFVTRIHEAIRRPYQCLDHQLSTDASIGIALAPQDGTNLDQLIKNADLAMYGAKAGGRRTHRFFEPAMEASAKARLTMEQDLRQALADGGFEIHYQPLVDLSNNEVTGCEALLRWRHPERGMVSPPEFIPVAEDTGLINELGEWVLRTACAEAANWPDHVRLAVNVSPVQLKFQTLALKIASALAASGLAPNRLELEITEAVLIGDDEAALGLLHQLRAIGVRIALDDFGTGYSSLSYLKRFPFDKIKIDRCFVGDLAEVDGSSTIVQAVVNIAGARNMTTTAEGVETLEQREMLRTLGCTEMQGYLFSAAKPGPEVRQLFGARPETAAVA
jgi:diguanylate cyclase (GGDEF)-like protein/PAS domain S-box-containing protein